MRRLICLLLFAYDIRHIFSWPGSYNIRVDGKFHRPLNYRPRNTNMMNTTSSLSSLTISGTGNLCWNFCHLQLCSQFISCLQEMQLYYTSTFKNSKCTEADVSLFLFWQWSIWCLGWSTRRALCQKHYFQWSFTAISDVKSYGSSVCQRVWRRCFYYW